MKQIEHNRNERRPKASTVSIITTSVAIGGGLALYNADWDALRNANESPIWALIVIAGFGLLFVCVHFALKGWDWLWGKITAR